MASRETVNNSNNLVFDQRIDRGGPDKYNQNNFSSIINNNSNIAKFRCNLFFGDNDVDDKFLVNSTHNKISDLINAQFGIGKTPKTALTIAQIQGQF